MGGDGFEAESFASSSFLVGLSSFIQGEGSACPPTKPRRLSCLSPEVSKRLHLCRTSHDLPSGMKTTAHPGVGADGTIDWSELHIPTCIEDTDTLAQGAHLAAMIHTVLCRLATETPKAAAEEQQQRKMSSVEGDFALALDTIRRHILSGTDSDAFVALCVCLAILEHALFGIFREGTALDMSRRDGPTEGNYAHSSTVQGGNDSKGTAGIGPVMILRDLIATPQIKAAFPEAMVTVLRLLLLPQGFNIRNLVWHGFLAPEELPRELASLVLAITLDVVASSTTRTRKPASSTSSPFVPQTSWRLPSAHSATCSVIPRTCSQTGNIECAPNLEETLANSGRCAIETQGATDGGFRFPHQLSPNTSARQRKGSRSAHGSFWKLDSFDGRLVCPPGLVPQVAYVISEKRSHLHALIRRSGFVLPGREELATMALDALRDGRYVVFLVATLPVLEHGLRCLFSCANDSPGHLFAQLSQYYSTLDGFGQRARHQLLLDQELNAFPGRRNLLLATLGPSLSACALDIFMMEAGPGLRGKVAHAEVDMSRAFSSSACELRSGDVRDATQTNRMDLVHLVAAIFVVLCRRLDPGSTVIDGVMTGINVDPSLQCQEGFDRFRLYPSGGVTSDECFDRAMAECEKHLSCWVPRFHPHELLEDEMQACWCEFEKLAHMIGDREVSVAPLSENPGLACMSIALQGSDSSRTSTSGRKYASESRGPYHSEPDVILARSELCRGPSDVESRVSRLQRVLTVVDKTSRLMLSPREVQGNFSPGKAATSKQSRSAKVAPSVLSLARRVRVALQCHCTRMSWRFFRINQAVEADARLSANEAPNAHLTDSPYHGGTHPLSERGGASAFSVYTHSQRCPGDGACLLDCLDPTWGNGLQGPIRHTSAGAGDRSETTVVSRMDPSMDADVKCTVHSRKEHAKTANDQGDRPAYMSQWVRPPWSRSERHRSYCRISPPTNVIKAVPLPQVGCMSALCRECANISRALRTRIAELEAQVMSSEARSGQRRAYAASLSVTPTLLCFLASTMSAVEAFVLEWDLRQTANSRISAPSDESRSANSNDPPVGIKTHEESSCGLHVSSCEGSSIQDDGSPPAVEVRKQPDVSFTEGKEQGHLRDKQRKRQGHEGSGRLSATKEAGGDPDSLTFLRRLAAVNGALSLCVLSKVGTTSSGKGTATESCRGQLEERSADPSSSGDQGSGVGGRKGYVQALSELATFLETSTAIRGFAGGTHRIGG